MFCDDLTDMFLKLGVRSVPRVLVVCLVLHRGAGVIRVPSQSLISDGTCSMGNLGFSGGGLW